MEPNDEDAAARGNVDTIGSKKPRRRLSSILKCQRAPTTVDVQVEVSKAVEKRLSRRVSFARANKVLLFSDSSDAVQNAPLHAAQQRIKEMSGVYRDTQDDYGERTMMFDGDGSPGSMDMTHCHTVLIDDDDDDLEPDAIFPEYNVNLPTRENLDFTFSVSNREAETRPPVKISSSDHGLHPEFENVLAYPVTEVVHNAAASLQEDQASDQGAVDHPTSFLAKIRRMRRSAVDKENQPPIFTSTMMEQPQGQSSNIEKSTIASDDFESESEFTMSKTRAGLSASIGMEGTRHFPCQSDDFMDITRCSTAAMDITRSTTVAIDAKMFDTVPFQNKSQMRLSFRTTSNATCNEFDMDMTRSQTIAIDADRVYPYPIKDRKSMAFVTPSNKTCSEFDMDMTRSQTVAINAESADMDMSRKRQVVFQAESTNMDITRSQTVAINAESAYMDMSRYRTVEFQAESTNMDMTRCQTVVIDAPKTRKGLSFMTPSNKTCNEFNMDMTRCQTVAINAESADMDMSRYRSVEFQAESTNMDMTRCQTVVIDAPKTRKGLSFMTPNKTCNEFNMDMTRSQTVAINAESADMDMSRYRTVEFQAESTNMDITRCQTVVIDAPKTRKGLTFMTASQPSDDSSDNGCCMHMTEEMETLNRTEDDSDMELTCQTGLVEAKHLDSVSTDISSLNICQFPQRNKTSAEDVEQNRSQTNAGDAETTRMGKPQSLAIHTLDCTINTLDGPTDLRGQEVANISLSASVLMEGTCEMARANSQTMQFEQVDAPVDATCHGSETVTLPHALESEEMHQRTDPEWSQENVPLADGSESSDASSPALHKVQSSSADAKTKRLSLVDLRSKLKRISLSLKTEPSKMLTMAGSTTPVSDLEQASDANATKSTSLPVVEPDSGVAQNDGPADREDEVLCERFTPEERSAVTAPLKPKSKRLTSRLSMGCFTPKLPQRNKPSKTTPLEPCSVRQTRPQATTETHQLSSDMLLLLQEGGGGIHDEVLPDMPDLDDLSETLEAKAPQGSGEVRWPLGGRDMDGYFECDILDEVAPSAVCENGTLLEHEDEKGLPSVDRSQEMVALSDVGDGTRTVASGIATQPLDSSNSSSMASLGLEATAESSFKPSLVESQLEDVTDWGRTLHKKLEDENLTMLEFFKCFGIDFAFYNHRQSVTPIASDLDCEPQDLLRQRYIDRPKKIVYEEDYIHLAETMEGLRLRMKDKDCLVRTVNGPLWEALRDLSEEELQCFGSKLKEKRKLFRRRAKVQSHEMKGALYLNLHHAYQGELQKLRVKNTLADEMLKGLDDCIQELQTDLDAVEGKDLNIGGPTLRSRQQELEKVKGKLADSEREVLALVLQKKQNMVNLARLRDEFGQLQNYCATLEMLNEWKLKEQTENHAVFSFVYDTMQLDVAFEEPPGDLNDASERNISNITLTLVELDDKKSKCHAQLVHKLLSQYIAGSPKLKERYPTRRCLPELLHSVSLPVSRCRLLGMEVDLMAKWGALRLNLLEISCVDTQVCLLFSSLKAFAKFELSMELGCNYPHCPVHLRSFKNHIGTTTFQQIEELVASVKQGKNMLTKIVKKINDTILC